MRYKRLKKLIKKNKKEQEKKRRKKEKHLRATINPENKEIVISINKKKERKRKEKEKEKERKKRKEKNWKRKEKVHSKMVPISDNNTEIPSFLRVDLSLRNPFKSELDHKEKKRVKKLINEIADKLKKTIDLCFLMDLTRSVDVGYWLDLTRYSIADVMKALKEMHPYCKIRIAFVGYRDRDCKHYNLTERIEFTEDTNEFKKQLNVIKAEADSDFCEDIVAGFEEVLKLEWKSPNQILIHFADSPCHGVKFHDLFTEHPKYKRKKLDRYPKGIPNQKHASFFLKKFKAQGIDYHFVKFRSCTDKMIKQFKIHYDSASNLQTITVHDYSKTRRSRKKKSTNKGDSILFNNHEKFDDETNKQQDKDKKFVPLILKVIKQNAEHLENTIHKVSYSIQKRMLENGKIPDISDETKWHKVEIMNFCSIDSKAQYLEALFNTKSRKINTVLIRVMMTKYPHHKSQSMSYSHVVEIDNGYHWIAKEFTDFIDMKVVKKEFINLAYASFVCKEIALSFNEYRLFRILNVLPCFVGCFPQRDIEDHIFYLIKPHIHTESIIKLSKENVLPIIHQLLEAFSHYTHKISKGECLLSEFKGLQNPLIITSLTIFIKNDKTDFGNTAGNSSDIQKWFQNHKCNQFCHSLQLKHPLKNNKDDKNLPINDVLTYQLLCSNKLCGSIFEFNTINYRSTDDHLCYKCQQIKTRNKFLLL
ncbi:alpha-protein kinase vwka [Anaeramoeba flamelloides]|uniref:Alpha-protein kinase vwka n=1 Tax=Anaeramoeba flamelloides TaxID=1746091 RepID=A0AAV7ZXK1_9EUKA|nr:alpha-protein kinase vwka [Anaeramoeba flamelloides]